VLLACSSRLARRRPPPAGSSAITAAEAPLLPAEPAMLTNSLSAAASSLKRVQASQTHVSPPPQVP
jgi:hypothetical protein